MLMRFANLTLVVAGTAMLSLAAPAAASPDEATVAAFPIAMSMDAAAQRHVGPAFAAAFGTRFIYDTDPVAERVIDGRSYSFSPVAIHHVSERWAILLSVGSLLNAGHSETGINAVHYLRAGPKGWERMGEWLGIGSVGSVGNGATSWAFSSALGQNPYLITAGGGVWQGCMVSTAVVTELTPDGPVDRGSFTDAMRSGGGVGQKDASYDGQIIAAKPDKSFTVGYRSTRALKQDYVLRRGEYQRVGKDSIPGC